MKPTIKEVHDALDCIIANQESKALNWAVNYAKEARLMDEEQLLMNWQIEYVLNNITYWRGDQAKAVRATLKEFVKTRRKK